MTSNSANRVLILDNYDSFTYNLVHQVEKIIDLKVDVFRNDEISISDVDNYNTIILSPGPGLPSEAGILKELISTFAASKKILGVCLGHQAIAEVFGGSLKNLEKVHHGIGTKINFNPDNSLFKNIAPGFMVGRYHSWVVDRNTIPEALEVLAEDENGEIMALRHKTFNVTGVQFHPESVLTPEGGTILRNFLLTDSDDPLGI